jgi:hypothetical protein
VAGRLGDSIEIIFADGSVLGQEAASGQQLVGRVAYERLRAVELGGPGEVTEGGGYIGGGFGIGGMLGGMALAGVLNSVTRSSSVQTVIRIEYDEGELWVTHGSWTSAQLRILLSEVFMAMR